MLRKDAGALWCWPGRSFGDTSAPAATGPLAATSERDTLTIVGFGHGGDASVAQCSSVVGMSTASPSRRRPRISIAHRRAGKASFLVLASMDEVAASGRPGIFGRKAVATQRLDKVATTTGAGGGIGPATAARCACVGAKLVLNHIDGRRLKETARRPSPRQRADHASRRRRPQRRYRRPGRRRDGPAWPDRGAGQQRGSLPSGGHPRPRQGRPGPAAVG